MPASALTFPDLPVQTHNAGGTSAVVLICEHASFHIPAVFNHLGLSKDARTAHIAWDPGALAVAERMSQRLDATLVAGAISRLVYDCNRPPEAPGAMPERSEVYDVPGNLDLSDDHKAARVAQIYIPFHSAVDEVMQNTQTPVLVTIHSFTPTYHGAPRRVEIGLLHDTDTRLTDAMLAIADAHTDHIVERNAPYGPSDGVTHTLQRHAIAQGRPNLMIEIRNDLIATSAQQTAMADTLARWISAACASLDLGRDVRCTA